MEQEDHTQASGKKAYYIIGYFLLAAILVVPATKLHIGMAGILFAMTGAGLALGLIILCTRAIKRMIAAFHMSRGQWMRFLWGYTSTVVEAEPNTCDTLSLPAFEARGVAVTCSERRGRRDGLVEVSEQLPDRIIEQEGLYLSETYQPGVNSMLGATLLFCGIRRTGKSNAMAVVIEELARHLVPMLICDTDDEYGSLVDRRYLPRGVMAGSLALLETAGEQLPHYIPIDLAGAFEFGRAILDGHLQVVLNLRSFWSDDEAALILCEIIAGMHAWEAGQPNAKRIPAMVFLDEANKWLPQNLGESMLNKDVQQDLQRTIFGTMVRRGGKQGLGLAVSTQRISELDKRALQSVFKFLFMQTEEVDVGRYTVLGLAKDDIRALQRGECFIFSPQAIGFRMSFRERRSTHLANTPGLNQLIAHRARIQPLETVVARSYVSATTTERVEEVKQGITARTPVPTTTVNHVQQSRLSAKQELALKCCKQGHMSVRALAAAMTEAGTPTNESEAYRLLCQLDVAGRIKRVKREATA